MMTINGLTPEWLEIDEKLEAAYVKHNQELRDGYAAFQKGKILKKTLGEKFLMERQSWKEWNAHKIKMQPIL